MDKLRKDFTFTKDTYYAAFISLSKYDSSLMEYVRSLIQIQSSLIR